MSPDTRPDPLADLLPIIDAAEAAVAAGALPVDVLNITQPVRYAIAHAGVTLTASEPQPDAGLRDDLRGLLHEISGDLDARADSGDDISRDLGDRLRAALRSTPAAPDPVADVLLVREQDFRSTPAAPKEDDRG